MSRKISIFSSLVGLVALFSACHSGKTEQTEVDADSALIDSLIPDSVAELEEEIEQADHADRLDGSFDDFLFAFTHSRKLQQRRLGSPLYLVDEDGQQQVLKNFDIAHDFRFMQGDYFTVMYGDQQQIEEEKEQSDTLVQVDRINLDNQQVRTYDFHRRQGRWYLSGMHDTDYTQTGLGDFLQFYAHFSTDSVFQVASIEEPLKISILDPESEESPYLQGTIDPEQWTTFCSDVPSGIISNIRTGQTYTGRQVILQKSGSANGLQELFTFRKDATGWKLTSYEN